VQKDEMDARQRDTTLRTVQADPDATIRLAPADPDATIRVGSRLSSQMTLQAARQQELLLSAAQQTQPLPGWEDRLQEPSPEKAHIEKAHIEKAHIEKAHIKKGFPTKARVMIALSLCLVLLTLVPVAGFVEQGQYAHTQQRANLSKAQLDHLLQHAQTIGVPASLLQPLIAQEQNLVSSARWTTLFPNPLGTRTYQERANQYEHLRTEVTASIVAATQQAASRAQWDLQNFQTALAQANTQPGGNKHFFSQQFNDDQVLMAAAQTPGDYAAISRNARQTLSTLALQGSTFQQLTSFNATLSKLQATHLDVTAIQAQYQHDMDIFTNATGAGDFQDLSAQLETQYQQLLAISVQTFPYVSIAKLNELTAQIQTLRSYGIDPTGYQKLLDADQVASTRAKTLEDELTFFQQVDTDIAAMRNDLVHGQAHYLVTHFHQEVENWSQAHPYHDTDGQDYSLVSGYMKAGIGAILDNDLAHAQSLVDAEAVITETQNVTFNLHQLETDYDDHTPFDQVHATDQHMLDHYQLQQKQILIVSLAQQTMRIYQDGKLVRAYQVTTGRQALPSLPGVWAVLDRKSPITFTAGEPPSSPYWFPDTPISYAILYHYGGYYVHDAPWRASFGPGTQFPHQDASGTTRYNFDGSHGCINLPESASAWVYSNTDWHTMIVIY